MSNYKTHSIFNIFLALPIFIAGIYYFLHPQNILLITFILTFAYCTLFMSPDMDLAYQIKLFSFRGFFSLPFRGYAIIFKHRGLSHSIIFGSLTRILWLSGLDILSFYLLYQVLPSQKNFLYYYSHYKYFLFYSVAGICLSDWCHLVLDFKKK